MKIQCDVCEKEEASVFCAADEAALCCGCDRRVHHANKLAGKHHRFSLLRPSSFKESPRCDICQERRAFLFCKEDRAILCRECDVPIHRANEHTQKHNRFLLTGVKLSAASSLFPTTTSSSSPGFEAAVGAAIRCSRASRTGPSPGSDRSPEKQFPANYRAEENQISDDGSMSTSSISEYLGTLPGWCVEDFLDPSTASNRFY